MESPDKPGNVFVDGKAVGATPLDVPVPSGPHEVEIEYPGGSREERSVDVGAGASADVKFSASLDAGGTARKGIHWGLSLAPWMSVRLDGGSASYGGTATFLLDVGITPMFELRAGVSAGGMYRGDSDQNSTQVTAVVPAMLGVNYSPWFSPWGGLAGGFILIKDENRPLTDGGRRRPRVESPHDARRGEAPIRALLRPRASLRNLAAGVPPIGGVHVPLPRLTEFRLGRSHGRLVIRSSFA